LDLPNDNQRFIGRLRDDRAAELLCFAGTSAGVRQGELAKEIA